VNELSYRMTLFNKLVELVDHHLGSLIEEIVERYYKNSIDLEIEYDHILRFIVEKLVENNSSYSEEDFKRVLREVVRESGVCKLVVSYLISEYIDENFKKDNYSLDEFDDDYFEIDDDDDDVDIELI